MKQLDDIINYYLKTDSNYAVMITGDWGIGKTYYYKNVLAKQIKETITFQNARKKYKPIIVSLFGLSSIEEIQTEIFLSLFPLLKNKTIKLGASIGKSLVKGILKLKGLGEYGEIISQTETNTNDWINFNEIVLCFDDFERLSNKLSIEELIGFINSLVENESIKVIVLANEDKIPKENYHALKEKVIGNTIEFIQDISQTYDSLIQIKFSGFSEYRKFLELHKNLTLEIFGRASNNIRILSFILDYFHTIYSGYITSLPQNDILREYESEVFPRILKFTIAVGCLYKLGSISFKRRENIEEFAFFDLDDLILDGRTPKKIKTDDEKTIREKFIEKYYKDDLYKFFSSIYDFITGGATFDSNTLISELKSHFHIQENAIPIAYETYNKLGYPVVFALKDSEYIALTRQMLGFADDGNYDPQNAVTIFYFATRFGNPLNLNLEKLERRIIKGLYKGVDSYKYVASLDMHLRIDDASEHPEHLKKIRAVAIEINNSLMQEITNEKYRGIEELYKNDIDQFIGKLIDKKDNYYYEPVLESFSIRKFYSFFLNASGEIKWKINGLFKHRYPEHPYSGLKTEVHFLEGLLQRIDKKIESLPSKGLNSFVFNDFSKILKQSIERLKS
ncbi:P-loop NTPase fold protein [Flavobacterium selenitireducens]|uniref:P-loop NTPase fold protein n=1 Tax=Flavobacterium selenitireducens TaxID=2722704 RepID=UPI00168A52D5|nr:P-loop NTPase fold protein [Flavobacterium selenitireducens]MBD3584065.1 hypothetical protein [Flavobacterium selenitireducens]